MAFTHSRKVNKNGVDNVIKGIFVISSALLTLLSSNIGACACG